MKGCIYVIGSMEHMMHVKVGLSKKKAILRLAELQCGNPFHLHLWGSFPVTRGSLFECEQIIHKALSEFHHRNEWFNRHPRDMLAHVEQMVEDYNTIK